MTLIMVLQFQVIRTNGNVRRIRDRESTVLVLICNVDYQLLTFLFCVARWGVRGESGLRNFERPPRRVSHISKYEQVSRTCPESPNMNRSPGFILKIQI